MNFRLTRHICLLAMLLAIVCTIQPSWSADSLYKRLGGYDAIAGFVDTAFPRVATHPQLTHLFRGHSGISQMRQRQLIVDALCAASGGPCFYTGREMKPVHVGLGITSAQWAIFTEILSSVANERGFAKSDKSEFLELLATRFKPDVVEKP